MYKKFKSISFLFFISFVFISQILLAGCGNDVPEGKPAIVINDYEMTSDQFEEKFTEVNIYSYRPEAKKVFLDTLIDQKILLQEAQRQGLDKQSEFLRSIEKFWEQSLLKIVIDEKSSEISKKVTVTETEVLSGYKIWAKNNPTDTRTYEQMKSVIRKHLIKEKQAGLFNAWIDGLKNRSNVIVDKKALGIK